MRLKITKKLILYFAVLLISALPAVFTNTMGGYLPFIVLFFCGALSFLQLLLIKDRLSYGVASGQELLNRGASVPFSLIIENHSFLPVVNMQAEFFIASSDGSDYHQYQLQITLPPHQKKPFQLNADFTHIGSYEAGFRKMVLHDLFDNFRAVSTVGKRTRLGIQPNIYKMDRLPSSTTSAVESSRATSASPLSGMEYSGVREYAYGDPMKTIQWKLSAHAGGLMTKLMESYTNTGLAIMMDFRVPEEYPEDTRLTLLDGIVETAASVGQYALKNGLDYILMYTDPEKDAKSCTPSSFEELHQWLPDFRLQPPGDKDAADFIQESSRGFNQQSNIVYCTASLTDSAVTTLTKMKASRRNVIVYFLYPEDVYDNERQEILGPARSLQRAQVACVTGNRAKEMIIR